MFAVLFKLMFLALGVFLVMFGAGQAFRSARRLDRRIAQFKAEQKEREEQGRALHPYLAMAELYQDKDEENAKGKKK